MLLYIAAFTHIGYTIALYVFLQKAKTYIVLGQTNAGRYLAVLFIYKKTREALVLSARDMASKERKQYGKK